MKLNENYRRMPGSYLFSEVNRRASAYAANHPDADIIRLGIGDVTLPLPAACVEALREAALEMGEKATFKGYGPDLGYAFLREAIAENEYAAFGAKISPDDIFISDGAKSDTANIQELFAPECVVAVPDPVYPVYVDSNALAGRAGSYENGRWTNLIYMPCVRENGFLPAPPESDVDLIYLCFPNNPTGAAADRATLEKFVSWARERGALILYDAAYRQYVSEPGVPRSIYEIDGADEVAIEFGSFSKTAGFTGLRCSWTVVPEKLNGGELRSMWLRRQSTKYNGTPYPVQRAAAAIYTSEGKRQVAANIAYYMANARLIRDTLVSAGITPSGGVNAPYIWFDCGGDSWEFYDRLLDKARVVGTPGCGFGPSGAGYFRLTAFGDAARTREACARVKEVLRHGI